MLAAVIVLGVVVLGLALLAGAGWGAAYAFRHLRADVRSAQAQDDAARALSNIERRVEQGSAAITAAATSSIRRHALVLDHGAYGAYPDPPAGLSSRGRRRHWRHVRQQVERGAR